MATLYFSLDGDRWIQNENWLSEVDECEWFSRVNRGVCAAPRRRRLQRETDKFSRMRRLVLYYNNLRGTIPPEVGLLTDLEEIYLEGGPLDTISGRLPTELSHLTALEEIHLANNKLSGSIPPEFRGWSELKFVDMSNNELGGSLSDDLLSGWTHLTELNLASNRLSGKLPNIWPLPLEFLDLEKNSMTGAVPPSIGVLQDLRLLRLDHNEFTSLPTDVVSLESLEDLSMTHNRLRGQILSELGFLPRLRSLRLGNNSLTGTIPPELGELIRLVTILDLSRNDLKGPIPTELGQINDRLRSINLSGNRLSGKIPESLSALDRLAEIRLDKNDLTGSVPNDLCKVWDRTRTTVYADCAEVDCPCCNHCCTDGVGCICRYAGDPDLAWRCA
uniref:L domain-like protein n=1 Tax=Amphora coffeiformis TaxID=265554 RepID=A0A7S3KXY8_9STRA